MNDDEVTISRREYQRLLDIERANIEARSQRESECEAFDRIYERRLKDGWFGGILQTRDGNVCYVTDRLIDSVAIRRHPRIPGDPRRVAFALSDLDFDAKAFQEPDVLLPREIRWYVETTTRIKGFPVFQEVNPKTQAHLL